MGKYDHGFESIIIYIFMKNYYLFLIWKAKSYQDKKQISHFDEIKIELLNMRTDSHLNNNFWIHNLNDVTDYIIDWHLLHKLKNHG